MLDGIGLNSHRSSSQVDPLITTEWGQSEPYNDLCPIDEGNPTKTGCVATAMAQIVNYWESPCSGNGYYWYNHPDFGTLRPWSPNPDNVKDFYNEGIENSTTISFNSGSDNAAVRGSARLVDETLPLSTKLPLHFILPLICISTPITLEEEVTLVVLSESLENIA